MATTELLRREWTAFRRPSRLSALAAAALSVVVLGMLFAFGNRWTATAAARRTAPP
jgi:hypothetical protein